MERLISVVIATYNQAWCIRETIESALAQTYSNTEIIVVDDASTDDTGRVVAAFIPRVTYVRMPRRTRKAAIARNIGIRRASGEYVAFLDGDDLWAPDKLGVQLSAAREFPDAGLIAVDGVQFLHGDGSILKPSLFGGGVSLPPDREIVRLNLYERLLRGCYIDTPSQFMVPTWVFRSVGHFASDLPPPQASDYDFLIRVAAKHDFVIVQRPLIKWRYRPSNQSGPLDQQDMHFALANIAILRRHLRIAHRRYEPLISNTIQRAFETALEQALTRGRGGERVWAATYIVRLLARARTASATLSAGLILARLWCPARLRRLVAWIRMRNIGWLGGVRR